MVCRFWHSRWTSELLFWRTLAFAESQGFWRDPTWAWMLLILWTAHFSGVARRNPSPVFWGQVGPNPPLQQPVALCSPPLHWVTTQLLAKHSLPVPVGQITSCQITKKRHYERGSIANSSRKLSSRLGRALRKHVPSASMLFTVCLPELTRRSEILKVFYFFSKSLTGPFCALYGIYGPEKNK